MTPEGLGMSYSVGCDVSAAGLDGRLRLQFSLTELQRGKWKFEEAEVSGMCGKHIREQHYTEARGLACCRWPD